VQNAGLLNVNQEADIVATVLYALQRYMKGDLCDGTPFQKVFLGRPQAGTAFPKVFPGIVVTNTLP
jgi:hypothetical protein